VFCESGDKRRKERPYFCFVVRACGHVYACSPRPSGVLQRKNASVEAVRCLHETHNMASSVCSQWAVRLVTAEFGRVSHVFVWR
jgi:hypothetical protein